MSKAQDLLGIGIYSIPEAAHLTTVHPSRIRRWLRGYSFFGRGRQRRHSPPVWHAQIPILDRSYALGFLDLIEIRFINAFRELGISWTTIRRAYEVAKSEFGTNHPFCFQKFRTDGRAFFKESTEGGDFVEVVKSQRYFEKAIAPYFRDLRFHDLLPTSWWPLGQERAVVLDPRRSFGKPIVEREGVPTSVLANALRTEKTVERVCYWYDVSERAVHDAVEFENKLAAA